MQYKVAKPEAVGIYTEIMTVHDLALYLKLSDAKIYRMAREGALPVIRIGKSWRFKKETIDDWLRNHVKGIVS